MAVEEGVSLSFEIIFFYIVLLKQLYTTSSERAEYT